MAGLEKNKSKRSKTKRIPVVVPDSIYANIAAVEPLQIEDMYLRTDTRRAHFKRLRYFGCPTLLKHGRFDSNKNYTDMNRDKFVREIYAIFEPVYDNTWGGHFQKLCQYIGWLDTNNIIPADGNYFKEEYIKKYWLYWYDLVRKGAYRKGTLETHQSMLRAVITKLELDINTKKILQINLNNIPNRNPHKALSLTSELKPIVKSLFKGFYVLAEHLKNGTEPDIHPMFDEERLIVVHGKEKLSRIRSHFVKYIKGNNTDYRNSLTRIAALICYMFTGMNTTPLLVMSRSDVVFKRLGSGKYKLESVKGRAGYQPQDTGIGFSLSAKRFIEIWLDVSAVITGDNPDAPLFPKISRSKKVEYFELNHGVQISINKILVYLGYEKVNPSKFRKTKLNTLMKVTEDVYLVAMAGNNKVVTVSASYSSGIESDHERSLSASTDAMYSMAKGKEIKDAVHEAKYKFKDVLSNYDYKRLRQKNEATGKETVDKESLTPLGVRCQDKTKGASDLIKKAMEQSDIDVEDSEVLCTDFLGCFECEHHALVAAVDDIWLMLSFFEILNLIKLRPAVSSVTGSRFQKLRNTIVAILERFRQVSESNYREAEEKLKRAPHPLYDNGYALDDLLEVFEWG